MEKQAKLEVELGEVKVNAQADAAKKAEATKKAAEDIAAKTTAEKTAAE